MQYQLFQNQSENQSDIKLVIVFYNHNGEAQYEFEDTVSNGIRLLKFIKIPFHGNANCIKKLKNIGVKLMKFRSKNTYCLGENCNCKYNHPNNFNEIGV